LRNRRPQRRQAKPLAMGPVQRYEVEGLSHEAKGVSRLDGKVTFIEGALAGETVEARVTKAGSRFDQAILTQIIKTSPHRISPPCPHFTECGGCSFQHLSEPQQLAAKKHWLHGQLRKVFADKDINELKDQGFAYRRRARIAVFVKDQQLLMGFRAKASKHIISIDNCMVLTVSLQQVFSALKQRLINDEIASSLGHIELLEDSQGAAALLRLTHNISTEQKSSWQEWAIKQQVALYWQHPGENQAQVDAGQLRHYQLEGLTLAYHPQDFIQVNARMNELMVAQAMEWLAPTKQDVILDLFCGVGNFSLPMAKRAQQVIGVEVQDSMVAAGRKNAQLNNLNNLSFVAADLTKPVASEFAHLGVTKVLLDPPRAGAKEFLDTLIAIKPQQILYVSCDAATLARDAEYLVEQGFKVLRVTIMDMFPQTSHVETMMLLEYQRS
jgi:23S rRNA (uracil1939-C5)-methyltransferase